MSTVTIVGAPMSSYVWACRMAAAEKGVDYTLDPFSSFSFRSEAHRALHPYARMPVLRHGERVLCETVAILCYLDEGFDGPPLQSADAYERARMHQALSIICDYVYPDMVPGWILPTLGIGGRPPLDAAAQAEIKGAIRDHMQVIDRLYDGRSYLAGDGISLADILWAPLMSYALMMPDGDEVVADLGSLLDGHAQMRGRDSFQASMPPET